MLSRVADSLYWMSRYVERTDSILRLLKINYQASQDNPSEYTWRPVLKIFTQLPEERMIEMEKNGRQVLHYMVADKDNSNSVVNMVTLARENARGVQDNITKELWQSLNDFYHHVRDPGLELSLRHEDPVTVLDHLSRQCMVYYGIMESTMFRGDGHCYLNIGKCIERAIQTISILEVKFSDISYDMEKTNEITYWKHLLMSVSGYALYLKKYRSGFEARNVVEQVLFNVDFPRSVLYSLNQLHRYFGRLKSEQGTEGYTHVDNLIGKVRSKVQYSDVNTVSGMGLHNFLSEITSDIYAIGGALNQYYFAYS